MGRVIEILAEQLLREKHDTPVSGRSTRWATEALATWRDPRSPTESLHGSPCRLSICSAPASWLIALSPPALFGCELRMRWNGSGELLLCTQHGNAVLADLPDWGVSVRLLRKPPRRYQRPGR